MKILVVSDTHYSYRNLMRTVEMEDPDRIFHLGDALGKELLIEAESGVPVTVVRGNCDSDISIPSEVIEEVGNHKALLTHGHYYGVGTSVAELDRLIEAAKDKGADMVMYGHTHVPLYEKNYKGITILNPGSITSPRQEGGKFTYAILKILENGEFECALMALN